MEIIIVILLVICVLLLSIYLKIGKPIQATDRNESVEILNELKDEVERLRYDVEIISNIMMTIEKYKLPGPDERKRIDRNESDKELEQFLESRKK